MSRAWACERTRLAKTTKTNGRPWTSITVPASAPTPVSVPVFARTTPRPAEVAFVAKRSANVPETPATASPPEMALHLSSRTTSLSTSAMVMGAIRLRPDSPLASTSCMLGDIDTRAAQHFGHPACPTGEGPFADNSRSNEVAE